MWLGAKQSSRFFEEIVDLRGICPSALRAFRATAAFATDDRRKLLDNFVCLKFRSQLLRNNCNERDIAALRASEDYRAVKLLLQRVGDGLQQFSVGVRHASDADFLVDLGQRLIRNLRSPAAQIGLGLLRVFLFPLANIDLEFFELRPARFDLL